MSRKMSLKRKYARTRRALSRGFALVALGYLIATFITQGAGSADEVSSVIAGISLMLTSLGLVRFGAEAPAHKSSRKAPAEPPAPTRPAPITPEGDSGRAPMPLGRLIIAGCTGIPTMAGFQSIKGLCAGVPNNLPLILCAMPTGNPPPSGWVTPGRIVVVCGAGRICPG